jgi:hypothetical protein
MECSGEKRAYILFMVRSLPRESASLSARVGSLMKKSSQHMVERQGSKISKGVSLLFVALLTLATLSPLSHSVTLYIYPYCLALCRACVSVKRNSREARRREGRGDEEERGFAHNWYLAMANGIEKGMMKKAATLMAQTGREGPLPSCGYEKGMLGRSHNFSQGKEKKNRNGLRKEMSYLFPLFERRESVEGPKTV